MSRSLAKSGNAMATKSLKEKWLSIVQLMREKGENEVGGSSIVTLPKMTGLFMSIAFKQEDQKNKSTKSPSQCNSLRPRNQRKSLSQTFALISPMSSQKRLIMFFPLIDPLITPLNSRIPLSPRLRRSTLLILPNRKLARLSLMNI